MKISRSSDLDRLTDDWTTLLIDAAREWPMEDKLKRPGWIPFAAAFAVLEHVYKDGIAVGSQSWKDDNSRPGIPAGFNYGGTQ